MNEILKATITKKLDRLPDEGGRQLLDYIDFLNSRYNRSKRERSTLERLADNLEGTFRATRIGEATAKSTAQVLDAAGNVMRGVASAGRAVVEELQRTDKESASAPEGTSAPAGEPDAEPDAGDAGTAPSEERGDEQTSLDPG